MKIKLTQTDLARILTAYFRYPVTEVVVLDKSHLASRIMATMGVKLERNVTPLSTFISDKILAIKSLRETIHEILKQPEGEYYGLAQSKFAIENWYNWIVGVSNTGEIPELTSSQ